MQYETKRTYKVLTLSSGLKVLITMLAALLAISMRVVPFPALLSIEPDLSITTTISFGLGVAVDTYHGL